jgi:precorrin-3B synthase
MKPDLRRGACPSLSRPMRTGDGLLVRFGIPGVGLEPRTLAEIAGAAIRFGNGMMDITVRGNVQIRGLTAGSAARLETFLSALGPFGDASPVMVNALAGIDRDEICDPRPLAASIGAILRRHAGSLAPKFSVIVDGGGQLPPAGIGADIRLCADRDERGPQWRIAVGGTARSARPVGTADCERTALAATDAIISTVAARGPAFRAAMLGAGELAEIEGLRSTAGPSPEPVRPPSPVGTFALAGGGVATGIGIAFGAMPAQDLAAFMEKSEAVGIGAIRFAPGRAMLLAGASEHQVLSLRDEALKYGFVTDPSDRRLRIAACAGAPACANGQYDTRRLAEEMAGRASPLLDGSLSLHLSGCAKRCAEPPGTRLAAIGADGTCELMLERDVDRIAVAALPAGQVGDFLEELSTAFAFEAERGETAERWLERRAAARRGERA